MQFLELFLSTIMNPPSFNEWQAMNDVSDMIVTGIAMLISLSTVPALIFLAIGLAILIATSLWPKCSGL
ncbi:hypothetical protein T040_22125 [Salmonella enterica subsp. enterica serovar Senftenberg]|uniref:hypothetical protein n=1 Tax=Enterobacter kobei TaxID=208224 RepID=UPI0012C593D0|nr:hypothetical protein [Enterobacter kobei]EBM7196735.1 hypothetical protein [Salmonella enterica]EDE1768791.1 hypothetical protein [Salmonella enterica subsp. enterica serovar Senftenberg]EDX6101262.1 hypothetical protein [Salmonella enterica subsp. enterica serovar Braenderup]ELK0173520.1 hypothetical protein [Escherichia coli]EBR5803925.1 hypothetical protein [Salmonella enterica]